MKIAADTNVLARAILSDDPIQSAEARALLESAAPLVISTVTLCELTWVLRSKGMTAAAVRETLEMLITSSNVEVDNAVARAGIAMMGRGGDFADGCILEQARANRCVALATFDSKLATLGRPVARPPGDCI